MSHPHHRNIAAIDPFIRRANAVLDERELRDGMEKMGIELQPKETRALMNRFQVGPLSMRFISNKK